MSTVKLIRVVSTDKATFGNLIYKDIPLGVTLELPYKDNQTDISCIPMGTYEVEKYHSHKYPDVWKIKDVPGRTDILIHIGNYLKDTHGCVLVATSFNNDSISSSGVAFRKLRNILPDNFSLKVSNSLF